MPDLQEYEVTEFQYQDKEGKSFKDDNGNTWCTVVFMGVSEPVRWVVKDPTKVTVGDKVFGRITDETSKAGKPYLRFRRESKPEQTYTPDNSQADEYWAERNDKIKAQFAIKAAIQYLSSDAPLKDVETTAKVFFEMVDRVAQDPNDRDIINLKDVPL